MVTLTWEIQYQETGSPKNLEVSHSQMQREDLKSQVDQELRNQPWDPEKGGVALCSCCGRREACTLPFSGCSSSAHSSMVPTSVNLLEKELHYNSY